MPRRNSLTASLLTAAMGLALCGPAAASELQSASVEQFRITLGQMRSLVAACDTNAAACETKKVSPDQIVTASNIFTMHWDWLSDALQRAHQSKPEARASLMQDCRQRLDEIARQVDANATAETDIARARHATDTILSGEEFQPEHPPSLADRVSEWINDKLSRLFNGLGQAASAAPWIWTLLEWGLFLGAAAGLVYFLYLNLAQQRSAMKLGDGASKLGAWGREAEDWTSMADASASEGDWREAVHGLYWAAIVYLESRRAWRHNPSRTPREYVRLLKPGSQQQRNLRGLTQIFERVWYGFEEVGSQEYQQARALFDGLSQPEPAASAPEAA